MAKLEKAIPMIPAQSVEESLRFWEQKLYFTRTFVHGDPPAYAGVERDGVEVHLFQCEDRHIAEWTAFRVAVHDVEGLYEEFLKENVIHPNGRLEAKPWGLLEFAVLDPAGVCITFAERTID